MGSRFAPSYANLFMGYWERINISPYLQLGENLITSRRYIDDCLLIWKGTEELLNIFIQTLNCNKYNLRFTHELSKESVNFLDLNIYTVENSLRTHLYRRETDCNGFIPYNSGHHRKWLNNIPRGQFGNIKRNCSSIKDYQQNCDILEKDFIDKGYDTKVIQNARKQMDDTNRTDLLATNTKKKELQSVPFITKFSKGGYKLSNVLRKHWHVLQMDEELLEVIGEKPSIIFTRPSTLRQSLAPSYLKKETIGPTWLGNI
ncbi:hypothetical protein XELAEV_18005966mg [Xenopus laevis]|uniref:Helix-turn-helix domain-containing protein n=1 Tax=Xenopus laevis TaxID=8355 RepID=A0A974E095_XENLA|nr:hypothetical protein XELAEV_18005966mg [Xenopus laevis]